MFAKLAQKNVDLYDNHPVAHYALRMTYCGVAYVTLTKMLKKIAGADTKP